MAKVPAWKRKRVPPEKWAAWLESRVGTNPVIGEFVTPGALVFDVGANRGIRTYAMLKLGAGHVVAVEPLAGIEPSPAPHLAYVFGNDPRVTVVPKAISPREGKARILLTGSL